MFNLPEYGSVANGWYFFYVLLCILGGLGLFLYGIKATGDNLKSLAGSKLKIIIEKSTNTPIKGVLVGILVTIILQSSSGTDALAISLVGAGLMSFPQAIGVILGANIGTTITTFIIGLKVQKFALVFIAIGAFMVFFFKKRKKINLGKVFLSIGFLFLGLDLMSTGISTLTTDFKSQTEALFEWLSNIPILGYLVGTIFTMAVQSSGATIAIVQNLYSQGAIKSLTGAITIMLGANLGTTITGVIAASGASKEARQVSLVGVLHKLVWTLLFMLLLIPFVFVIQAIETNILSPIYNGSLAGYGMMTIAIAHMIFNILATGITMWFTKYIAALIEKLYRTKKPTSDDVIFYSLGDYTLIHKSPALAAEFVKSAIYYMANTVNEFFELAYSANISFTTEAFETGLKYEEKINTLDKKIHDYLIKITREDKIDKETTKYISKYLDTIGNLERIGDHCANLIEFAQVDYDLKTKFSEQGEKELKDMFDMVSEMIVMCKDSLLTDDKTKASKVLVDEEIVDDMEEVYRKNHFIRVKEGICVHDQADNFIDRLSNLERIGDHCDNIANSIIDDEYSVHEATLNIN